MGKYTDSPDWADVVPLVQEEASTSAAQPLAQIAYSDDYSEAMSYLRAVMAADEKSERVLELTETIIRMNPAHYTVWLYRAATLKQLDSDLVHELTSFLNPLSLSHLKNYQIWHHRQTIMDRLPPEAFNYQSESEFLQSMFSRDTKNYHVWSYRQWLVRRFALWDERREWDAVESLINEDVRNNSAWNHRWYLSFARPESAAATSDKPGDDVSIRREFKYAMEKVDIAPQNASPWNYIRGLLARNKSTGSSIAAVSRDEVITFAKKYAGGQGQEVRSSHALELLASLYADDEQQTTTGTEASAAAASESRQKEAVSLLELLADKYDPIRAPYWRYRIALVNGGVKPAAVAAAAAAS